MITKGQKINNRYEIIRTIGEGGMANVYLGYDTILDRNVAIKVQDSWIFNRVENKMIVVK